MYVKHILFQQSDPDQGQPIDPSRLISGRLAMTNSVRRARQNAHIPKREIDKGRMGMVQGVLRLHNLKSHMWLTRPRWSTLIIRNRYTMPLMVVMMRNILRMVAVFIRRGRG